MRILITGNMGYVGPVLVKHLRSIWPDAHLVGFDAGYFAHCLTGAPALPEALLDVQYFGDVRAMPCEVFKDVDAVVHLAAVSNDPIGARFEDGTLRINAHATLDIARQARDAGVKHFVYASSCSTYGFAADGARSEEDPVSPLTAYARSKVFSEEGLAQLNTDGAMTITCLRFATACGFSDRLRLDLVLNDFVASAYLHKNITVLSDGTPWRPLIDVRDMARAIEWAITRKESQGGAFIVVNAGANHWNYRVSELAAAVAEAVPGTSVSINASAPPDKRSYQVDFSLFAQLAPRHVPQYQLKDSIASLLTGLERMHFSNTAFRESDYMRLKMLERHVSEGRLDQSLRWV